MIWRRTALALLLCAPSALGCSGGGSKAKPLPGDGGPAVDAGSQSPDDGDEGEDVVPGTPVDVDGDGTTDGEAVDTNGDGVADGVDTDGDGDVDLPLPVGGGEDTPDGGSPGTLPGSDAAIPFPVNEAGQVLCDGAPCACSDGADNDTDGLTDLADPECVASWDNDEASFATGISGDNRDDACQDCFFDGNSGSGNDGCRIPSSCLTAGEPSSGQGSCSACEQPTQCVDFCKAFTPNGCDCFGCCTVQLANGTTTDVALGDGCQIDGNTVGEGCQQCVKNDSCNNSCGRCELCPGKTLEDIPADCFVSGGEPDGGTGGGGDLDAGGGTPTTPTPACEDGAVSCTLRADCPSDSTCEFGCCVKLPYVVL